MSSRVYLSNQKLVLVAENVDAAGVCDLAVEGGAAEKEFAVVDEELPAAEVGQDGETPAGSAGDVESFV